MKLASKIFLLCIALKPFYSEATQIDFNETLSRRIVIFNLVNKVPGVESGKPISVTGELNCLYRKENSGAMPLWCDIQISGKKIRLRHLREDWDIVREIEKNFSPVSPFENDLLQRIKLDFKLTATNKHEDARAIAVFRSKRDISFSCKSDDSPHRWLAGIQISEKLDTVKVSAFAKEGGDNTIPSELTLEGSAKFSAESGKSVALDALWSNASLSIKQSVLDDPERFSGTLTIRAERKDVNCLISKNF
jgi:hypothetical protein